MNLFAADIIPSGIPSVKTSTLASDALSIMEEYKVAHLAVVNNEEFLGLVAEDDLLELTDFTEPLGAIKLTIQGAAVGERSHIFDIMRTLHQNKLTVVPVVDSKNNYLGCLLIADIMNAISELLSVSNPGGIIILEMNVSDYSLTQISSIIESNDSLIIASFVQTSPNSTQMQVILKINNPDIGKIIQTFNRYEYNVVASFGEDMIDDILRDRYDLLMRYLNI
jgi:CBS domain-containing protein